METGLNSKDAYAAIKLPDFRRFIYSRFLFSLAIQMQSVVIGWQIYHLTHDALSLGMIGLTEVIPFFIVVLFAGHLADTKSRKGIILNSVVLYTVCIAILLLLTTVFSHYLEMHSVFPLYVIIFFTGMARGFMSPAQSALFAQLIPRELLGNASTWNSVVWQIAAVSGPAVGGLVCGFFGFAPAYSIVLFFLLLGIVCLTFVKKQPIPEKTKTESIWESLTAGVKYVFRNQIILSAISLDMFAVFFGGAVCVLPIFADQVLHIGAEGLGFLRAAPAVGAIFMSIGQAFHPQFKNAGRNLLFCVAGFGVATILFAISANFYLSFLMLLIGGMFDNVSVVIRATIIQLFTPDEMRGRVAAVNSIFIGSSNELGSFESGVAAKIMGLVPSVIFGGTMTLLVVEGVRKFAPKLKTLKL
jgi:MFS family permease